MKNKKRKIYIAIVVVMFSVISLLTGSVKVLCDCFLTRYGHYVAFGLGIVFIGGFSWLIMYLDKKNKLPGICLLAIYLIVAIIVYVVAYGYLIDLGSSMFPVEVDAKF